MLGLVTYCLILVTLIAGTWFRPAVGVAAVLCLYGLKQWGQSTHPFFIEHGTFTNYAIFAVTVLGLVRTAVRRSCLVCNVPVITRFIVALLAYALFSIVWSPDTVVSFEQWIIQGPYIITIALLAPLLFNDAADVRVALRWSAWVGAAICTLALLFGKWGARGLLLFGDVHEWETNPLAIASLGGTVFLVSALSLVRPSPLIVRIIAMACIPIGLAVILKSGSRGQLIAGVIGTIVALPITFRMKDVRSLVGLFVVVAIIGGLASWGSRLVEIDTERWQGAERHQAVADRFDSAERLIGAAASGPLTTVFGLGNSSAFQVVGFYPHIAGLEVIAEEGLVGAALYTIIMILAIRSALQIASRPGLSDAERNVLAMVTGLFVFEFILTWKQGSLLSSVYVFLYGITLARLEHPLAARPTQQDARAVTPVPAGAPRFQNLLR